MLKTRMYDNKTHVIWQKKQQLLNYTPLIVQICEKKNLKLFTALKHHLHSGNRNTPVEHSQISWICWHPSRFPASPFIHHLLARPEPKARFSWAVLEPSQGPTDKWGGYVLGWGGGSQSVPPAEQRRQKTFLFESSRFTGSSLARVVSW